MVLPRDVAQHPRLPEFIAGKFYSADFKRRAYRFITVYAPDGDTVLQFAHLDGKYGMYWITPANEIVSNKEMITLFEDACDVFGEIYFDVYTNDIFKPNPRTVTTKRIFRYHMNMSDETKKTWGGNTRESKIERLYNVESVNDVKTFTSISQVLSPISDF